MLQYLDMVRSLPGYNEVRFPHCKCDARSDGHIIITISRSHIRLRACSEDGEEEEQEHMFSWDLVVEHEADMEEAAFTFQYTREGKKPRWVKIYSDYVSLALPWACLAQWVWLTKLLWRSARSIVGVE